MSISYMELVALARMGLRPSLRDMLEGSDLRCIASVLIRAMGMVMLMAKEKNDSVLSNSSVITTTQPNNTYSEPITPKESSLVVGNMLSKRKQPCLIFLKPKVSCIFLVIIT